MENNNRLLNKAVTKTLEIPLKKQPPLPRFGSFCTLNMVIGSQKICPTLPKRCLTINCPARFLGLFLGLQKNMADTGYLEHFYYCLKTVSFTAGSCQFSLPLHTAFSCFQKLTACGNSTEPCVRGDI